MDFYCVEGNWEYGSSRFVMEPVSPNFVQVSCTAGSVTQHQLPVFVCPADVFVILREECVLGFI